jgi:hypothetical protein
MGAAKPLGEVLLVAAVDAREPGRHHRVSAHYTEILTPIARGPDHVENGSRAGLPDLLRKETGVLEQKQARLG